jgi:hypothetical protein
LPLDLLAARLNDLETSSRRWTYDPVTDTGPLLRLSGKGLNKAQRYADPDQRPIYASAIPEEMLEQEVRAFFHQRYAAITPRRYWTWAEIREAGTNAVAL